MPLKAAITIIPRILNLQGDISIGELLVDL